MQTFIKVVETKGFSAAARELGRSKALVSKYVKELESELGVRLLNRTTRQLSVTEAGAVYYREAVDILRRVGDLEEEVSAADRSVKGRLRIAAPRGVGDDDIAGVVMAFARLYPAISIDLRLEDRFVDLIEEGVDAAIRVTEPADSSLIARRLGPLSFGLYASPECIAETGAPAHPAALADLPCIIDTNYRFLANWVFRVDGERQTVRVSGRIAVNSLPAGRAAALAGLGFARLPLAMVRADVEAGRLVRVLEGTEGLDLGIYVLYPHRQHLPAKVRALVDFLVERFNRADGMTSR